MVEQEFIDKFRSILQSLESSKGDINLFGLFKMDEVTDKWTVLIGANWINKDTYDSTFYELRDLIFKFLDEREQLQIARAGLFGTDNHLIKLLIEKYEGTDQVVKEEQINGNFIHDGYIIQARKSVKNNYADSAKQEKLL